MEIPGCAAGREVPTGGAPGVHEDLPGQDRRSCLCWGRPPSAPPSPSSRLRRAFSWALLLECLRGRPWGLSEAIREQQGLPAPQQESGKRGPSPSTIRAQSRLRPLMQMSLLVEKVLRCSRMCSNSPAFCSFSEADSVGRPQN